jgi:soluble lytic murein transglycosylase-like protein
MPVLERKLAEDARAGRWDDVLAALRRLSTNAPDRYVEGRFDYLAARALAAKGFVDDALPRFERYISANDLFDTPARLAAGKLRFAKGDGLGALELLFPLLQRKEGAVTRRALRTALDALETRLDAAALARLVAARPSMPTRERRRLTALRAEALEAAGDGPGAAALRREVLAEAKRDDAAAIVLARELRGSPPAGAHDDRLLSLLIDTARAQRDMELAERLATERERRAFARTSRAEADLVEKLSARFDLARLRAGRGKFVDAEVGFRSLLAMSLEGSGGAAPRKPARVPAARKGRRPEEDKPPSAGFFARVRFNLAAVLEKQLRLDEAAAEFRKVEAGTVGPHRLAALQRARLELRRGDLALAERILSSPSLGREPGYVEALLLLADRACDARDAARAARLLARLETGSKASRLPEPWKTELPFWRGRVAEAAGDVRRALQGYAEVLAAAPRSEAAALAKVRVAGFDAAVTRPFLETLRARGLALLDSDPSRAKEALLPPALLGDAAAVAALRTAYRRLPAYDAVLRVPDYPDEALANLCGDAAACRLIQLGLAEEGEPIVRDALRLDTLSGCVLAARLAERADAGPAALEAAESLSRKTPSDFLLDLAPGSVRAALAPRPFDRLVGESAKESGVPKDLLYAVMRQESRFDREAVSPAAARGLMQLTLPAAGEAARDLNEEPPAYADLYDPARSLRLGAQTIRRLLEKFSGDAASVVAAYNAGAGQTTLWSGGSQVPAEALLAAISYPETRVYFRRVLANKRLYEEGEGARGEGDPQPEPVRPAAAAGHLR